MEKMIVSECADGAYRLALPTKYKTEEEAKKALKDESGEYSMEDVMSGNVGGGGVTISLG